MHKTSRGKLSRDIEKECNECVRKNLTWQELPIHLKQVNNFPFVFELVFVCVCVCFAFAAVVVLCLSLSPYLPHSVFHSRSFLFSRASVLFSSDKETKERERKFRRI